MTGPEILQIASEMRVLVGRRVNRLHSLSRTALAVSFSPHPGTYLFADLNRRDPSIFLIVRKAKILGRAEKPPTNITRELGNLLQGAVCRSVDASPAVIRLVFEDRGRESKALLIVLEQGSGGAVVVGDNSELIASSAADRTTDMLSAVAAFEPSELPDGPELSHQLDQVYRDRQENSRLDELAAKANRVIGQRERKLRRLFDNLAADRERHGSPDEWKKYGDLILANLSNLKIDHGTLRMTDFYDPELRQIELPIDANQTPSALAERYFKRYAKARNALVAIKDRERQVLDELQQVARDRELLAAAVSEGDEERLERFGPRERSIPQRTKIKGPDPLKGTRRFVSSDGVEILVGKKAVDNDFLTFRVARSLDLWLHAADYPGSHVVVRNPGRGDVPQKTLIEAAKLAAFYSDARELPKAAVNYTPRKFVNKPRRSAPGLVSLSNFRTILVEPSFPDSVQKSDA